MATIEYFAKVPDAATFKKDSSVTLGSRSGDALLRRIDQLLEELGNQVAATSLAAEFNTTILYGQLYHAVDGWLKERARGVGSSGREPAVRALYTIVCTTLAKRANVGISTLPNWLTAAFGRDLSEHGEKLDYENRLAQYLSSTERAKYRIRFNGGIAQQMQWWLTRTNWQNVDSARDFSVDAGWREGHSGYALSQGGDFYSGPHKAAGKSVKGGSFFHSSYMAGDTVRCAGTWKIVNGKLLEITDASGHYLPTIKHMLGAIETLKGYGVDLSAVRIFLMSQGNPAPEFSLTSFMEASQRLSLEGMAAEFTEKRKVQQVRIATQVAKHFVDDEVSRKKRIANLIVVVQHLSERKHVTLKGTETKKADDCATCAGYSKEWKGILEQIEKDRALAA